MANSGSGHKAASVILRFLELACGAIVLGLLGRFCYLINETSGVSVDGRIIYAMVVAGMTIVYSIVVFAPIDVLFMAFPFDFILFIMWLIAFCLLETGIYVCTEYIQYDEKVNSAKQQMRKLSHSSHPANGQNRESTATRAAEDGVSPTQPRSEV
ncbi:hypothetical protein QWA68_014255 [Fusarium oxysporum]|nr:hypothetical protein QWA68_014255 [Fusarium oxysporum]